VIVDRFNASFPTPLVSVFRIWLHTGWVDTGSTMGADAASPPVYRTLGQFVSEHVDQLDGWENMPVRQFLAQSSQHGTVRDSLYAWIKEMIPWLLDTAVRLVDPQEPGDWDAMQVVGRQRLNDGGSDHLAATLLSIFETEIADLTLMDTFRRRRHEVGFASWSQENAQQLLEAEELKRTETGKPLFLDVIDATCEEDTFEWAGVTKDAKGKDWLADAAGMLYLFERRTRSRAHQLLCAADAMRCLEATSTGQRPS